MPWSTVEGFPCSISGVISTICRENRGGWFPGGASCMHLRRGGCCCQVGSSGAGSAMPGKHRPSEGGSRPSRSLGSSTHVPRVPHPLCTAPTLALRTFLQSVLWKVYFRVNAESPHPPRRPVVPPLPTAACLLAGVSPAGCHSGEEQQPAVVAHGGPTGKTLLSRCQVVPSRSFPPLWVN